MTVFRYTDNLMALKPNPPCQLSLWEKPFFSKLNDVILMKQKCLCCEFPVYKFSAQKSSNSLLPKHCFCYHRIPSDLFLEYSNDNFLL